MKKIIYLLCMIMLLGIASAQAATFSIPGDAKSLDNRSGSRLVMDDMVFIKQAKDNRLDILDKNNNKVLSLRVESGICSVKRIICKNPNKIFYEIKDPIGAHGELAGYWLIGECKDKWVVYVNLESLRSMGAHFCTWRTEARGGSLIIPTFYNIPPGARLYHEKNNVDIELFWDDNAQWFGMRRVD